MLYAPFSSGAEGVISSERLGQSPRRARALVPQWAVLEVGAGGTAPSRKGLRGVTPRKQNIVW